MHTWLALMLLLAAPAPRTLAATAKHLSVKEPGTQVQAPRQVRGRVTLVENETVQTGAPFDGVMMSRIVRSRNSALRACYERELRTASAPFEGRIVLGLTVTPAGSVIGVHLVSNGTGNTNTAMCTQRVVQGFRFNPGPEGEAHFTLTLEFHPE